MILGEYTIETGHVSSGQNANVSTVQDI